MDQEPETPFGDARPDVPGRRPADGRPIRGRPGRALAPGEAAASRQNSGRQGDPQQGAPRQNPSGAARNGGSPANPAALPARQGSNDLASQAAARRALDARSLVPLNPNAPQSPNRLPVPVRQQVPPPIGDDDLTTTMPIFLPLADLRDEENPPPGEPGHSHSEESGRHRGSTRAPRGLILTGVFAVAVAGGIALTGAFSGNSATSANAKGGPTQARAGGGAGAGAGANQTSSPSDAPSSDAAAAGGASPSDGSTTPSDTTTSATTHATATRTTRPITTSSSTTGPTMGTVTSAPGGPRESTVPVQPPVTTITMTSAAPTTTAPTSLKFGDTGPAVQQMQQYLSDDGLDWLLWGYTKGRFDQQTQDAVHQFQRDHKGTASADGWNVYGPATQAALLHDLGLGP